MDAPNGPASATSPSSLFASGKTADGTTLADKLKSEELRSMDDVKSFFLRGIVQPKHPSASQNMGTAGKAGMGQTYGSNTRSGSGYGSPSGSDVQPVKVRHNRIYTDCRNHPEVRQSVFSLQRDNFGAMGLQIRKDGVVHVHFTQVGYAGSSATSRSETLRLEVKSVDSSSAPSAGGSRF